MENKTYVKCNMFKRGNNLFSYYRKNRELYIYVYVKDLYVHSHFYIGNISQNAPQGYLEVVF